MLTPPQAGAGTTKDPACSFQPSNSMNPICLVFGHQRSRGRAREIAGELESVCRRCGTSMVRVRSGVWVTKGRADSEAGKDD
jgi:hypothetical protein